MSSATASIFPGERLAAERNAYVEVARAQTGSKSCGHGDSLIAHPYLAFVQTALGPCGFGYANSKSLLGKEFPDRPRPRTGIILVTGGSVAAQFVGYDRKSKVRSNAFLTRSSPVIVSTGSSFLTADAEHGNNLTSTFFGLYADILTGVITLDGFNEHYMINSRRRFEEPASLYFQVVERQDPA